MVAHELATTVHDPHVGMLRHQRTCPFPSFENIWDICERWLCQMSLRLAFDLRSIALDRHDGSLFEENLDAATLVSQARVEDRGRASNYGGRRGLSCLHTQPKFF